MALGSSGKLRIENLSLYIAVVNDTIVRLCVCVCVRERERERVCVCVCVRKY